MEIRIIKERNMAYLILPLEDASESDWRQSFNLISEMREWCLHNLNEVNFDLNGFKFKNEEDMILFTLRWV